MVRINFRKKYTYYITRVSLCILEDGIVSYSITKGVQRGLEIDLSDKTYDGYLEDDKLVSGLGQLVDGQRGKDNFRTDIHGFGKGMYLI